ncbi:hypothetical protein CBR_g48745 [Chara braunii]|uniref:Dynein axonemal light chain 1 n=1 Tax=Chara braunii TaxID=69332 RepID=A0A388K4Q9_CHABU|nr:hypothetical protein CBR_g48745 [Chara braunii]|eukprot:GBG64996.1 hypothetical protein CBR_g48745 [Chara braunii]
MPTTVKDAIRMFEEAEKIKAAEAERVLLYGQIPPIEKMDNNLSSLKMCTQLSLSTNNIDKIAGLSGLENLKVLSLSRNQIKKIENLDGVAATLEELWISYNLIEKLTNIEKLENLRVLYISNNKIDSWAEIERLAQLPQIDELLLIGNPLYDKFKAENPQVIGSTWRLEVLKRIPRLKKLDGVPVEQEELDAITQAANKILD